LANRRGADAIVKKEAQSKWKIVSPILFGQDVRVRGDNGSLLTGDRVGNGGNEGGKRFPKASRSFECARRTVGDHVREKECQLLLVWTLHKASLL